MGSRTEGVGRGVNWGALSNIASMIARAGEVNANMYANIGPMIRQNIERNRAIESEQKRYDEQRKLEADRYQEARDEEKRRYEKTEKRLEKEVQRKSEYDAARVWVDYQKAINDKRASGATSGSASVADKAFNNTANVMKSQIEVLDALGQYDRAESLRALLSGMFQEKLAPLIQNFVENPNEMSLGNLNGQRQAGESGGFRFSAPEDSGQLAPGQVKQEAAPSQPAAAPPQGQPAAPLPAANNGAAAPLPGAAQIDESMALGGLGENTDILGMLMQNPTALMNIMRRNIEKDVESARTRVDAAQSDLDKAKTTQQKAAARANLDRERSILAAMRNSQYRAESMFSATEQDYEGSRWLQALDEYRGTNIEAKLASFYKRWRTGDSKATIDSALSEAFKDTEAMPLHKAEADEVLKETLRASNAIQANMQIPEGAYQGAEGDELGITERRGAGLDVLKMRWEDQMTASLSDVSDRKLALLAANPETPKPIAEIARKLYESNNPGSSVSIGSGDVEAEGIYDFYGDPGFKRELDALQAQGVSPDDPRVSRVIKQQEAWFKKRGVDLGGGAKAAPNAAQQPQDAAQKPEIGLAPGVQGMITNENIASIIGRAASPDTNEFQAAKDNLTRQREVHISKLEKQRTPYKMQPGEKIWSEMTPEERRAAIKKMKGFSQLSIRMQASMGKYPVSELERIYLETDGGDPEEMRKRGYLIYYPGEAR